MNTLLLALIAMLTLVAVALFMRMIFNLVAAFVIGIELLLKTILRR